MTYQERLDLDGRLLVLSLHAGLGASGREELLHLWGVVGESRARSAARLNQVEAAVGYGLRASGVELSADWLETVQHNGRRAEALIGGLGEVVADLEAEGIASAVVEAGGVLLGSDMDPRFFCPGDLDLLIAATGWDRAREVLATHAFVPHQRGERSPYRVEFRRPWPGYGTQRLEVTCQPFDRAWAPPRFRDLSQQWLHGRIEARKGEGLSVLAPADSLAFVAIHTSLHDFVRAPGLRLHLDVDRLVRDCDVDWSAFVETVTAAGARRRVGVSLAMARGLLETPIPEGVLEQLVLPPSAWGRVERILLEAGSVADGRPKLGRLKLAVLEALLDDEGLGAWLAAIAVPPEQWLRARFGSGDERVPVWRLHARRLGAIVARWRTG